MTVTFLDLVLWGFLAAASVTDVLWKTIPNAITYSGIVAGLILRGWLHGSAGVEEGLKGFTACGGLMLVCYVLLGIGGGDVKLIAMMGAFLGLYDGFEALLWTLVIGGVFGMALLIWQIGLVNLVRGMLRHGALLWRAKSWVPLNPPERMTLKQPLFLAPAALIAAVIVGFHV